MPVPPTGGAQQLHRAAIAQRRIIKVDLPAFGELKDARGGYQLGDGEPHVRCPRRRGSSRRDIGQPEAPRPLNAVRIDNNDRQSGNGVSLDLSNSRVQPVTGIIRLHDRHDPQSSAAAATKAERREA